MKKVIRERYIDTLFAVINLVRKMDYKYIYISLVSMIIFSIFPVISARLMQHIVNLIQGNSQYINLIYKCIVCYVALDFTLILIQSFWGYYNKKFKLFFNLEIKRMVLKKASYLKLKDFENSKIYDMLQRAERQSEGGVISYFELVLSEIGAVITGIAYVIIIMFFKWWIVFALFFIPILRYVISSFINKEEFKMVKERTDEERKAWYYSYIVTCGINFKELRIYNLFEYFIQKYCAKVMVFNKQDLKILKKRMGYMSLLNCMEQVIVGYLFGYIILCGVNNQILIGDVLLYTKAMISTRSVIQNVIQNTVDLNRSKLFVNQLFDFLNLETSEAATEGKPIEAIHMIEVKNLSYRYPESSKWALRNISFTIKKGDYFAIVGQNGSGKSTLMKLILGLYDDYEGEILVNRISLQNINMESYQERIGVLFQDFVKYEGTIKENAKYSCLTKSHEDNQIIDLCNEFGLEEVLRDNNKNIDVQLGYWFDSGKQLSFGQWQKLALVRTFLRDVDCYVLDEPNAALDPISEYQMSKRIKHRLDGKIGILITHKLNNYVEDVNKILVLKNGEVLACGTHEELFDHSLYYREIYNKQQC